MDLDFLEALARKAGAAILEIYETSFSVAEKEDRSPLTEADTRSHEIVSGALKSRYPDIPVLSEEGKEVPFEARSRWSRFWLVDPLDGTKEFIKRNGEFTVNIALVEGGKPVLGLIYIPVSDLLYVGRTGEGCRELSGGRSRSVRARLPDEGEPVKVVRSRSHPSPQVERMLDRFPSRQALSRGSALKFCALASGEAHFYPRLGPTWEWDTGAGHTIVLAAGGVVVDVHGSPLEYNKPNLVNGPFLAAPDLSWLRDTGVLEAASSLTEA